MPKVSAVLVLVLATACSKRDQESLCLAGHDPKVCMEAANGMRGKEAGARVAALYARACEFGDYVGCASAADVLASSKVYDDAAELYKKACVVGSLPAGCVGLGRAFRDGQGVATDIEGARMLFQKGCDMKDDTACKELAALPAAKPVAAPASADAGASGPERPSWDLLGETSNNVELCTFIVGKLCTRCGGSDQLGCFEHQGHTACAALESRWETMATPEAFRKSCAAALDALACKNKDALTPPECIPPRP
jgi:hypothetical protein